MEDDKTCIDCKFYIELEYGFSNYSWEGTEIDCIRNKNKDFPADRFYGLVNAINFAKECTFFNKGPNTIVDNDHDLGDLDNYNDDIEVKHFLKIRGHKVL